MPADQLLQYPALVEPFDAALAESIVTVDMWYVEPADVMRRRRPVPHSLYVAPFTPTLPPPPVAPDLPFLDTPIPAFPRPRYPTGGMVEPVFPLRNYSPSRALQGLIPKVPASELTGSNRARYTIDRLVDVVNSLLISGRIDQTGVGEWSLVITSADVADALGFMPSSDTGHEITSITDGGTFPLVTTDANHGLTTGDLITIVGTSLASYNGDWMASVLSPTTFALDDTSGTPGAFAGVSAGGFWRFT